MILDATLLELGYGIMAVMKSNNQETKRNLRVAAREIAIITIFALDRVFDVGVGNKASTFQHNLNN